jgi:hypothetical protein
VVASLLLAVDDSLGLVPQPKEMSDTPQSIHVTYFFSMSREAKKTKNTRITVVLNSKFIFIFLLFQNQKELY